MNNYEIADTLAENGSVLVCRARQRTTGESIVLKIPKPSAAAKNRRARLRHEFDLLSRLHVPGVVEAVALEDSDTETILALKDIGGQSLDRLLAVGPLAPPAALKLAVVLARKVALLHAQHVVHKDINPSHIIVNPATGQINLIAFGLAQELPEEGATPLPSSPVEGTLAYVSPEQTGRMNRPVDCRSDLYSVGVTLYQMLTGHLPFEADDDLGMVYSHVAKTPVPPDRLKADIPHMVSRIVMKLMSKMADDRYQTASGLEADLARCLHELATRGTVPDFELGLRDYSDRVRFPERLCGRQEELAQLLQAFARVSRGERELFLVGGYAGVGKTRLVRELQKTVLENQGHFVEGKFDPLLRNLPYLAWIQAFEELVNHLLMRSEGELNLSRQKILRAVGNIGRVLTDVIPNLQLIVGPQPPVPELGGIESQNRFNYVFLEFVKAIATSERPLVVFLDDLQWIEPASLRLLEALLTANDIAGVLVIGAYRDNEVDELHPLFSSIERLGKANAKVQHIALAELTETVVNELLAETLRRHHHDTRPVASKIYAKTGGNPFFLLQTVRTLVESHVLSFDALNRVWQWDASAIEKVEITENVVALMVSRIRRLPSNTQQLLLQAACMGFKFSMQDVAVTARQPDRLVAEVLQPAIREGLIMAGADQCQFVHDRIQQAAYAMIPQDERPAQHLRTGRLLLENTCAEELAQNICRIVDHLNRGLSAMPESEERRRLAELNLAAGRQARTSTAFNLATNYFAAGKAALGTDAWEHSYDLAFALHSSLAECESLLGNFVHAETLLHEALAHARSVLDHALVYRMYQRLYQQSGRWPDAVSAALKGLQLLGVTFPETDEEIRRATEAEKRQIDVSLRGRRIADLAEIPFVKDAETQLLIGMLAEAITQFFITRPVLWHLIVLRCVNLCLERGNVEEAPYIYSSYCKMLVALYDDIPSAFEFSQMSLRLNEHPAKGGFMKGLPPFFHASVVGLWRQHFRINLPLFDEAFQAFLDSGDLIWASYLTYNAIWIHIENGDPLGQVIGLAQRYAAFNKRARNDIVHDVDRMLEQLALSLQGKTQSPTDLSSANFDEEACATAIERANFRIGTAYYRISKQIAAFIASKFHESLDWAERAKQVIGSVSSMAIWGTHCFFDALALAALHQQVDAEEGKVFVGRLREAAGRLAGWAKHCPENFAHRSMLVRAELARIEGRGLDAERLYEDAISSARENGFVHYEAIACEVAAAFYRQRGLERIARSCLQDAADAYARWGAEGKVRQLEGEYPWLVERERRESVTFATRLDAISLAKAQRAISSKMDMEKLLGEVMQIVMESAGAQNGTLLVDNDGSWQMLAQADGNGASVREGSPVAIDEAEIVPPCVVRFVARTKESVVLEDAVNRGDFTQDPFIRRRRTRSVVCAPLVNLGHLVGVLYLENNLTTHAFTPTRVQLLEMLLSQVAISLENARIYRALRDSEAQYRRIIDTAYEGVWVLGRDARTTFVNARMASMLGRSPEDMLGHACDDFMFEEDVPAHWERMEKRRQGKSEISERRFRHGNGQAIWTLASAVPLFDDDGRVFMGSFAMLTDITDRKHMEDALRKREADLREAHQQLERRVIERTAQLESANKELEAFAYTVSHDLRAPLRHIDGFVHLLEGKIGSSLDHDGRHYMQAISSAATKMRLLIDDLLSFSREGRQEMSFAPVPLEPLVREIVEELAQDAVGRDIMWTIGDLPTVQGDAALLRIVLVNLISNALKFTRPQRQVRIDIGSSPAEGSSSDAVVFVRDNGVGFDMAYANKLFGVFQRLHGSDEFEGTGIGLATVRRIVGRHGGRTWAEGKLGQGATVYFTLPRAP